MSQRSFRLAPVALAGLLAAGAALTSLPAAAHGDDLQDLANHARAIVHTRVAQVDYTQAEANGRGAVPHTLVTFEVVRPLRGQMASQQFTLRFIGGPDGQGRFLRASEVPVFQAGDEDILFLQGTGESGCALSGCLDGRFRIANGVVHDGTGAPVVAVEQQRVVTGGEVPAELRTLRYPRPSFDALMRNPQARAMLERQGLSMDDARRRYEAEAPAMVEMQMVSGGAAGTDRAGAGEGRRSPDSQRAAPARALSADTFATHLRSLRLPQAEGAQPFAGLSPEATLRAPSSREAPAPQAPAPARERNRSAADTAEQASLPADDLSAFRNKSR
ncbi:hypothetical protein [Ideonella sp.]|uniref:hypothetical protein n=1 Tax=Ideonella sp. TaxID=1929293 RepID=UPI0035B48B1B